MSTTTSIPNPSAGAIPPPGTAAHPRAWYRRLHPATILCPLFAFALTAGALAGSDVDLDREYARHPVERQRLGAVGVDVPAVGAPVLRAEIGRPARGRLLLWRETSTGSLVHLLTRRVGELTSPIERIEIGSGHDSDGSSPGAVLTTSPTVPFELRTRRGGLPAGRYAVELQLRSTSGG